MTNITTIEQLKQYLGQFLAFQCGNTVWIQKLHSIYNRYVSYWNEPSDRISDVDHLNVKGLYTAQIYPSPRNYTTRPYSPYNTNAQEIIRTPTKEEMKIFQNIWRHYRVFGKF